MKFIARSLVATVLVASLGAVGAAGTVSAASACPARSSAPKFSQWGDQNLYFVAPQARFEGATGQWTRTGSAGVVAEQSPWRINGATDSKAMRLPAGASITSPPICVAANQESMRFFFKSPGTGKLRVTLSVTTGGTTAYSSLAFNAQAGWNVSQVFAFPAARNAVGDQWITVSIAAEGGTWLVDDVMVDPWITR